MHALYNCTECLIRPVKRRIKIKHSREYCRNLIRCWWAMFTPLEQTMQCKRNPTGVLKTCCLSACWLVFQIFQVFKVNWGWCSSWVDAHVKKRCDDLQNHRRCRLCKNCRVGTNLSSFRSVHYCASFITGIIISNNSARDCAQFLMSVKNSSHLSYSKVSYVLIIIL